ncbi:MAG TPA: S41 family peptidase [Gemmataceae bacterium]|nr:S41 family peptidase [Gemmataceae bacterium]
MNSAHPVARCTRLLLFVLCVLFAGGGSNLAAAAPPGPVNLDFKEGEIGQVPTGWFMPAPSQQAGFVAKLTEDQPKSGKRCLHMDGAEATKGGAGILMQSFEAVAFRGKRVRFRAAVRADVAGPGNTAQLWMRVDRKDNQQGFFDNMMDRPITAKEWRRYDIVGDVADDAESISIGLLFLGKGQAWLDAASFQVLGPAGLGDEPARSLQVRELDNLVAFTRLLGYVRYFHPSDQSANADWDRVAIEGVVACQGAKDSADLARRLEKYFKPLAPTVRVFVTGKKPELPEELHTRAGVASLKTLVWLHLGVGTGSPQSIYSSRRISKADVVATSFGTKVKPEDLPVPEKPYLAELGGGVSALVPLALFADAQGTLPHVAAPGTNSRDPAAKPEGFLPSGNDRATRLAAVALAWNTFQHFYPYFDVVQTDWPAALRRALTSAAADRNEADFLLTLRRLVAELHDGHGHVAMRTVESTAIPPFLWDWVENQLVVTQVAVDGPDSLKPGDVILKVNGLAAGEALAQVEKTISGATPQWRRYRGLHELATGPRDSTLTLEVQPATGKSYKLELKRTVNPSELTETRPEKVTELKPGIWYLDLDRIVDADFTAVVDKLAKASGIIFDMRAYPHGSTVAISHLIDKPVESGQWHIPITLYPDRTKVSYSFSNWSVAPQAPRFKAKVAFITDGRAISYAETYLGIIEHYKLAAIVGGPTAGTNGNINPMRLPGGYTVAWTGMRVLKQDGSRHHGVGIQPTIPAKRTIQGVRDWRDELLVKALEAVRN